MKTIIKNRFAFTVAVLCVLFFAVSGCDKLNSFESEIEQTEQSDSKSEQSDSKSEQSEEIEQSENESEQLESESEQSEEFEQSEEIEPSLLFIYPETGKYGLNILAEEFVEGKRFLDESTIPIRYSLRAELPVGNSNLKIIIKSVKSVSYVCFNCLNIFYEPHEICPECGSVNTLREIIEPWVGVYESYIENWLFYNWDKNKNNLSITWAVYESEKPADAAVMLVNDFIIEYYENGATEPTKIKEVKVIE